MCGWRSATRSSRRWGGLVRKHCADHGVRFIETEKINTDEIVDAIGSAQPDYLFSIYNLRIIKTRVLALPRLGVINYHNGPPPRYRGVNIYSWAILNGEKEHGVTWHFVNEGIDTGGVIAEKRFAIDDDETPFTLARKCFQTGVELLGETLPGILGGAIKPTPQDHSQAVYYSLKDTPNDGRVDFGWAFDRLERFVRALDFTPLENNFVYPKTGVAHRQADFLSAALGAST